MEWELILRLFLAVLFGSAIGFEREYRSKAAGFRTITIIALGSTLFTICSFKLGGANPDRIAANIITGIGFIGAGVIFRDSFSVTGLTTAATIWVAAAMGMAIGIGEYFIASATLIISLIILALFEKLQDKIDSLHQDRLYKITLDLDYEQTKLKLEEQMKSAGVDYRVMKSMRTLQDVTFYYNLAGRRAQLDGFNDFLLQNKAVKSFGD